MASRLFNGRKQPAIRFAHGEESMNPCRPLPLRLCFRATGAHAEESGAISAPLLDDELQDSSLVARRFASQPLVQVASPPPVHGGRPDRDAAAHRQAALRRWRCTGRGRPASARRHTTTSHRACVVRRCRWRSVVRPPPLLLSLTQRETGLSVEAAQVLRLDRVETGVDQPRQQRDDIGVLDAGG